MSGFRVDEMSDEGRFMVLFRSRGMLGEGEHCQVFVCVDLASGAEFAAKVHKRLSLRRLQDTTEMQLNEMLQDRAHPSVIAPVACTSIRGLAMLVYPMCRRGDLFSLIDTEGPLPPALLARIAQDCLLGLDFMHRELQWAHVDIKPENILLTDDRHCLLTDFGFAQPIAGGLRYRNGTRWYMAPEVERIGVDLVGEADEAARRARLLAALRSIDPSRADVWSLGVTLYACATRRALFGAIWQEDGRTPFDQDWIHRQIDIVAETSCPPLAKDFLKRLLRIRADERPSAHDALRHPFLHEYARDDRASTTLSPASSLEEVRPATTSAAAAAATATATATAKGVAAVGGAGATAAPSAASAASGAASGAAAAAAGSDDDEFADWAVVDPLSDLQKMEAATAPLRRNHATVLGRLLGFFGLQSSPSAAVSPASPVGKSPSPVTPSATAAASAIAVAATLGTEAGAAAAAATAAATAPSAAMRIHAHHEGDRRGEVIRVPSEIAAQEEEAEEEERRRSEGGAGGGGGGGGGVSETDGWTVVEEGR